MTAMMSKTGFSPDRAKKLAGRLACPDCKTPMSLDEPLRCGRCERSYDLRDGVPAFFPDAKTMPLDHQSNPPPPGMDSFLRSLQGMALNIGGGSTPRAYENCIEFEYCIFRHTDVVGDAHHLPFADASFDAVMSFNTFEHLHSPDLAAREIWRVLKPGGRVWIQTAFLQPLHQEPIHYYNATKYGVRRWFADYDVQSCDVSANFSPALTLAWLCNDVLFFTNAAEGEQARHDVATSTIAEWQACWTDESKRNTAAWRAVDGMPQHHQERLSLGFELKAAKPVAGIERAPAERTNATREHDLFALEQSEHRASKLAEHIHWLERRVQELEASLPIRASRQLDRWPAVKNALFKLGAGIVDTLARIP